uniref:Uncharacterized protein n=1 Tax=viral metagenome TaxID=1070528 RepID=A0A6M3M7W1_9ZZZZ
MIHAREILDTVDGQLCVRYETTYDDEPILVMHWWPIGEWTRDVRGGISGLAPSDVIGNELRSHGDGVYSERDSKLRFRLRDGGATMPIRTTETDLLPPKGYPKATWRWGNWQKGTRDLGIGRVKSPGRGGR